MPLKSQTNKTANSDDGWPLELFGTLLIFLQVATVMQSDAEACKLLCWPYKQGSRLIPRRPKRAPRGINLETYVFMSNRVLSFTTQFPVQHSTDYLLSANSSRPHFHRNKWKSFLALGGRRTDRQTDFGAVLQSFGLAVKWHLWICGMWRENNRKGRREFAYTQAAYVLLLYRVTHQVVANLPLTSK